MPSTRSANRREATARGLRTVEILSGTVAAVGGAPELVLLFLLVGGLTAFLPDPAAWLVRVLATAVGVVAAHLGLGGAIRASSSFVVRLLKAVVATVLGTVPVLLGLLLLVAPGVYVAVRLFVATPAVMVDDQGPVEALATSWELMDGSVAAAFGAALVAFAVSFVVVLPFALAGRFLAVVVASVVGGSASAAAQALLYLELRETR